MLKKSLQPVIFTFALAIASLAHEAAQAQYSGSGSYRSSSGSSTYGREYTLGLAGNIFTGTTNNQSLSVFNIDSFFGWNLGAFEAGPKLRIQNASFAGGSSSLFGIGGYGDFNFVQSQAAHIGITGNLLLGSVSSNSAVGMNGGLVGTGTGTSLTAIELGGVLKWFALRSASTALRFELLYQNVSTGGIATSGLVIRYGLQTYF